MAEFITTALLFLWSVVQAYILVASLYVLGPAVIFILCFGRIKAFYKKPAATPAQAAETDFVLLIPAHNEERFLPKLLASIQRLDYPALRFTTLVVADNCTDATALLALQAGVPCVGRFTAASSDKTQALRYAVGRIPAPFAHPEAVVCIIDADCELEPDYLRALDRHYTAPDAAPVVQSYRRVSNAFDSDVTVLDAAAEALRQWVLSGTRRLLGLDNFLFGLGCSMRAAVFEELMALPNTSLAEDKEWKVYLTKHRRAVAYCPTAGLSYEVVSDPKAFEQQRNRWLMGYFQSLKTHGFSMLARGLRNASPAQLDLAGDLLQPPRSVLVLAAAVLGGLAYWQAGAALVSAWVWGGVVLGFLLYGALGMWLIGAHWRHYLLLFAGFRLLGVVVRATLAVVLGRRGQAWTPTSRASQNVP